MIKVLGFQIDLNKLSVALAPIWLWLCLLLGGASQGGAFANLILQLGAGALIAYWLWVGKPLQLRRTEKLPAGLMLAGIVWILIMFVPLPPAIWQWLPGRDFVADGYRLLGMKLPWLSMALAPDRAVRSALLLLIPVATWLLVRSMDRPALRRMLVGVVTIAAISAALGLMQVSTGPNSVLRLYSPTNQDAPVGLFANTNHFSIFLACTLPLSAAWIATADRRKGPSRKLLIGFAVYAALVATTLIVGRSVAGLGFLILGLIGAAHILWGRSVSGKLKMAFLGGTLISLLVAGSSLTAIGTGAIGAKFEDAPTSRSNMTPVTIAAGTAMAPTGAGLGSFAQIYAMHQPDRYTSTTWANHAHNDYAEIYLELGIVGILLVAVFLFWFVRQGLGIWRNRSETGSLLPQAAWLSASFMLLHSAVDYPLRTAAMAALFAALLAIIVADDQQNAINRR